MMKRGVPDRNDKENMEDLSYLTTEYARNKMIEGYDRESREREKLSFWPCQYLQGGLDVGIIDNKDGMCTHKEYHPDNDDRKHDGGNKNGKCSSSI